MGRRFEAAGSLGLLGVIGSLVAISVVALARASMQREQAYYDDVTNLARQFEEKFVRLLGRAAVATAAVDQPAPGGREDVAAALYQWNTGHGVVAYAPRVDLPANTTGWRSWDDETGSFVPYRPTDYAFAYPVTWGRREGGGNLTNYMWDFMSVPARARLVLAALAAPEQPGLVSDLVKLVPGGESALIVYSIGPRLGILASVVYPEEIFARVPALADSQVSLYDMAGQLVWRAGAAPENPAAHEVAVAVGGRAWRLVAHARPISVDGVGVALLVLLGLLTALTGGGAVAVMRQRRRDQTIRVQLEGLLKDTGRAAEAKTQFLQLVSHEMRGPLNGILGVLQLPRITPDDMELMRAGALSLRNTIDNILLNASPGGYELRPQPGVVLREEVRQAVSAVGSMARADVRVLWWVDPELPELWAADPTALATVLTNLLSNACKFTTEGVVALLVVRPGRVAARGPKILGADAAGPGGLLVCVQDTGPGIDPGLAPWLFEPFTQGELPRRRTAGGTGLGLSNVRMMVAAMGGHLRLAPGVSGRGCDFQVRLPLKAEGSPPPPPPTPPPGQVVVADDCPEAVAAAALAARASGVPVKELVAGRHRGHLPVADIYVCLQVSAASARRLVTRADEVGGRVVVVEPPSPRHPLGLGEMVRQILWHLNLPPDSAVGGSPAASQDDESSYVILTVDDNPAGNILVQKHLGLLEPRPRLLETENGEDAVRLYRAQKGRVDLVLMDIHLPLMDGVETMQMIRDEASQHGWEVPAWYALTGDMTSETRDACAEQGAIEVLTRPLDYRSLRDTVRAHQQVWSMSPRATPTTSDTDQTASSSA